MKQLLLLIFSIVSLCTSAQTTLQANPDSFTVLQAKVDTFAVTTNDSIPTVDSVCITLLDTVHFSLLNCTSVIYHPDSAFTGRDTCRYVLCDTALICDTSMVVVNVDTNWALLPIVYIYQDSVFDIGYVANGLSLFNCNAPGIDACASYQMMDTGNNSSYNL